jgi:hypothetical protein
MKNKFCKKQLIYNRLDTVAGIDYVESYEKKWNTDFFKSLHLTIKKFWNNLVENEYSGAEQHIKRFNNLIKSVKTGYQTDQPIPLSQGEWGYSLFDGYHRFSICYYHQIEPTYEITNSEHSLTDGLFTIGVDYFRSHGKYITFPENYLDYMVQRYLLEHQVEFSCVLLFPNDEPLPPEINNKIKNDFLFELKLEYPNNLKNNLILMAYADEPWCTAEGGAGKANPCFSHSNNPMKIVFLKKKSHEYMNDLKTEIRKHYNTGNDSCHSPDTQEECNWFATLFNNNTREFMQTCPTLVNKTEKQFQLEFLRLKDFCTRHNVNMNRICVTSSAVLSAYCIRDCNDIDILIDKDLEDVFRHSSFDRHNKYAEQGHYITSSDDIIYNPDNHFYYFGVKFCTLEIIYKYKQYRIENKLFGRQSIEKDKKDIQLIENSHKFKNEQSKS